MTAPVWFITGASSGFGRAIAFSALRRGHSVVATSRNSSKLSALRDAGATTVDCDVTAPLSSLQDVAKQAYDQYGRIDYLIAAAGYILEGAIEEASPEETLAQFTTNVFGAANTLRAVLPYLRLTAAEKHATGAPAIANFGSIGSWTGSPGGGLYCATKWAVSGLSEALRAEVADFGISVCVVEPGYFRSGFLNVGNRVKVGKVIDEYERGVVGERRKLFDKVDNNQPGDIEKGAEVIVEVLTRSGRAEGKDVPVRLVLGSDAQETIRAKCEQTLRLLDEQRELSNSTDYPKE